MEVARLYEVRGRSGEIVAILRRLPCYLCPEEGHPRATSSNDFRAKLLEAVLQGGFPVARSGRFGRIVCWECRTKMKAPAPVVADIEGEVHVDEADITVILTAPQVECPRCGRVQLDTGKEVAVSVRDALHAALARGGLVGS